MFKLLKKRDVVINTDATIISLEKNVLAKTKSQLETFVLSNTYKSLLTKATKVAVLGLFLFGIGTIGLYSLDKRIPHDISWTDFVREVEAGMTSGHTYKLMDNVGVPGSSIRPMPVTEMLGDFTDFRGSFDGNGNTITVNFTPFNNDL